jgi:hypothetical protein
MKLSVFIAASFGALPGMVLLGTGVAQATDITGTIPSTLTITTDSQLTGNVICGVTTANPCIKFGNPGIKLKLNGFSMTGQGKRDSCTLTEGPGGAPGQSGIDTNGKKNVSIEGPGVVTRFNDIGIVVSGNNSSVQGVAITSSCREGIRVLGSYNAVVGNSISRASLSGSFFTGIFLSNPGGHNSVLHNEVVGAGPVPGIPLPPSSLRLYKAGTESLWANPVCPQRIISFRRTTLQGIPEWEYLSAWVLLAIRFVATKPWGT